jgi:hypothetical protein
VEIRAQIVSAASADAEEDFMAEEKIKSDDEVSQERKPLSPEELEQVAGGTLEQNQKLDNKEDSRK